MLPTLPRVKQQQTLRSTTLRGFSGGLNALDDELNLSYRYSTILDNCYAESDGTIQVRYGTLHVTNLGAPIINMEYFSTAIIAVLNNGNIVRVNGDGTSSVLFNGWGPTTFASFAQFNGHLIICNGSDKPLDVDSSYGVEYLQDAATNTNINTPVCRYVVTNGRYLVMTGDALNPERVHISARDAAGTWFGDPAPNDATHVDVGSVLASATTIRGALSFRDKLLILYAEGIVVGTLGKYDTDNNHVPAFDDAIEQFGSVSHRVAVARGDDGLFMDLEGVPSISRTVLSGQLKPERASELIDSLITKSLSMLSFQSMQDRTFAVYDHRNGQYMLFIPNTDSVFTTTETKSYVYSYRPVLKQDNWSTFSGWNWSCGCRSLGGSIFFGDYQGNIWLYGSQFNPIYADRIKLNNLALFPGTPISFTWEMPWMDMGARDSSKTSKHISFDTRGNAEFTCEMFVDQFDQQPALSSTFNGGDQLPFTPGQLDFNGNPVTSGVRVTTNKRIYAWPCKFQLGRLRFSGTIGSQLAFVSVTLRYQLGGINR